MTQEHEDARSFDIRTARELGQITTRLDNQDKQHAALKGDISAIRKDVNDIKDFMTGAKGGWKALAIMGGIASAAGALAAKVSAMVSIHAP